MFKLQISLNYGNILENVVSWRVLMLKKALMCSWSIPVNWHLKNTNNDRHILHAWLDKDYRLPGMWIPEVQLSLNVTFVYVSDSDQV